MNFANRKISGFFICVILFLYCSPGLCTIPAGNSAPFSADSLRSFTWTEPAWGHFLKILLLLVLVIGLIWVSLALLRRVMGLRTGGVRGVVMAGGIPLGQRRSIQFVKIGKMLYLLGVTEHHVSLISSIDDPEEIDKIVRSNPSSTVEPFASMFRKVSRKFGNSDGK